MMRWHVQLALFHAGFTWLTLRMFRVHFVYATTVAAAATALLPLIPSWLVAVPAALQLVIQVHISECACNSGYLCEPKAARSLL